MNTPEGRIRGRGARENPPNRFEPFSYEKGEDAEDPEGPGPKTSFFKDTSRTAVGFNDSPDVGFSASINPYRGCEHGCAYCLDGETPILMSNGSTKPLQDILPGDVVYGTIRRGWYRRYVKTPVLAHWRVVKPAYRVSLACGTSLIAGADHRFLTERGWKYVTGAHRPHLTVNNKLMGVEKFSPPPYEGPERITRDVHGSGVRYAKASLEGTEVGTNDDLRVLSISPAGVRLLYDITTGTGDFIADGAVSHNCYARPTHEYLGFSAGLDFETKIMVKEDAPALLRAQLSSRGWKPQVVAMSGVTDCYQPMERKLKLTRRCLEVLAEFRNPAAVITKNFLVTRDADVLAELAKHDAAMVVLSVTTLDENLSRLLEPRASRPAHRLAAIEALAKAGVPAGVNIAPVIPGLTDHEIPAILQACARAGARFASWGMVRLPLAVAPLFEAWLEAHFPGKKNKVLNRLREMRGGKLNNAAFGERMRGKGVYADGIRALFRLSRRKSGIPEGWPGLSAAAFRKPPGPQLTLF